MMYLILTLITGAAAFVAGYGVIMATDIGEKHRD